MQKGYHTETETQGGRTMRRVTQQWLMTSALALVGANVVVLPHTLSAIAEWSVGGAATRNPATTSKGCGCSQPVNRVMSEEEVKRILERTRQLYTTSSASSGCYCCDVGEECGKNCVNDRLVRDLTQCFQCVRNCCHESLCRDDDSTYPGRACIGAGHKLCMEQKWPREPQQ